MKKLTRAQKLEISKVMNGRRIIRYEQRYIQKGREHIESYSSLQCEYLRYIIEQINEGNTSEDFFVDLKSFGFVDAQETLEEYDFEDYLESYYLAEEELENLNEDNSLDRYTEDETNKELQTSEESK